MPDSYFSKVAFNCRLNKRLGHCSTHPPREMTVATLHESDGSRLLLKIFEFGIYFEKSRKTNIF
jgi:hypothetical protein